MIRREAEAAGLADTVVVNTCAVTAEAVRQARQAIRKLERERPQRAHRGDRLRGADRAADLRRHARGRPRARQRGEAQADGLGADARALDGRARSASAAEEKVVVNDIMAVKRDRAASRSTASRAARAPSCRCRTAATTAARSASSRMGAAIRARCRWARWSRRCAAGRAAAIAKWCSPASTSRAMARTCRARRSSARW